MPAQIFDENTTVKYPLSDFHESPVPDDILVDLNVAGPATLLLGLSDAPELGDAPTWIPAYSPIAPGTLSTLVAGETSKVFMTNLVKRSGVLFVSFEAAPDSPVCHLSVVNPEPFKMYQMAAADGVTAWIVFGPGIELDFDHKSVVVPVDARCLITTPETDKILVVNGVEYPAPRVLTIEFNDAFLVTEDGHVTRNDSFFQDIQYGLREDIPSRGDRLYDVGGAPPDKAGNINIVEFHRVLHVSSSSSSVETWSVPIADQPLTDSGYDTVLGAIINNITWQGCDDWYATFRQKFDLGIGCPGSSSSSGDKSTTGGIELPMDYIFTGCCETSSSSSSSSSSLSSSSSASSEIHDRACGTGCYFTYQKWSYGDCDYCAQELADELAALGRTPYDVCFDQSSNTCGTEPVYGCDAAPPGYATRCGVCCIEPCYDICVSDPDPLKHRHGWPTSTGMVSGTTEVGANTNAMAHCAAVSEGCLYGPSDCSIYSDHGCVVTDTTYDTVIGEWVASWKLCCFTEEPPS